MRFPRLTVALAQFGHVGAPMPVRTRSLSSAWPMRALLALALLACTLPGGASAMLVTLALAPLVEEIVFRHGVQAALLRLGAGGAAAVVATAAVFALAHGLSRSWPLAAAVFVPALLIGAVYHRQRRLARCVGLHAGFNAVLLLTWPVAAPHLFGLEIWRSGG